VSAIVAIPARLKSTRFPRKVLADLNGRPMLWHVYQGVSQAESISAVWVLTDSPEVLEAAASWGAKAMLTAEECPSGTDRIASVIDALDADIIVNVQGDEPLIKGLVVDKLVAALQESGAEVATPVYAINSIEEVTNPNVVKVVRDREGRALYFSRSPIPHVRDADLKDWLSLASFWGHAGVYAYRREVLREYHHLPAGRLEQVEKLEQLRLLEAGKQILTVAIDYRPNAVDVPHDLERVKKIIALGDTHDRSF
jgi:3-deoxy-manno-octulosonate cytidylyltransferase (CMP-KDO synthetase)